MKDDLETVYKRNGFEVIDITSNTLPVEERLEWFEKTAQLYVNKFPEHERMTQKWLEAVVSGQKPKLNYIMLVIGRNTSENPLEVGVLAFFQQYPEYQIMCFDYLASNNTPVEDTTVSGFYLFRKAIEYANTNGSSVALFECELPEANTSTDIITVDPGRRIRGYLRMGAEFLPFPYPTCRQETQKPYLGLLAIDTENPLVNRPDYQIIKTFYENIPIKITEQEFICAELKEGMMQTLKHLVQNPNYMPEGLSDEIRELKMLSDKFKQKSISRTPRDVALLRHNNSFSLSMSNNLLCYNQPQRSPV